MLQNIQPAGEISSKMMAIATKSSEGHYLASCYFLQCISKENILFALFLVGIPSLCQLTVSTNNIMIQKCQQSSAQSNQSIKLL